MKLSSQTCRHYHLPSKFNAKKGGVISLFLSLSSDVGMTPYSSLKTLIPKPQTSTKIQKSNLQPQTQTLALNPGPQTQVQVCIPPLFQPSTSNLQPQHPNPSPRTLNPEPQTSNAGQSIQSGHSGRGCVPTRAGALSTSNVS